MQLSDVCAVDDRSISVLRNTNYNFCSNLQLTTPVRCYGAVMSKNGLLVNRNDYVAFTDEEGQVNDIKITAK